MAEAVNQIQGANVPKIEQSLKKLNITLASFLTDPAILMKFLSDQVACCCCNCFCLYYVR